MAVLRRIAFENLMERHPRPDAAGMDLVTAAGQLAGLALPCGVVSCAALEGRITSALMLVALAGCVWAGHNRHATGFAKSAGRTDRVPEVSFGDIQGSRSRWGARRTWESSRP